MKAGSTVRIKGYVYVSEYGHPSFFQSKGMESYGFTLVAPAEFDYTIPADFNPVAQKLAALEAEMREATEQYQLSVARIKKQISELQAIEFTGEPA